LYIAGQGGAPPILSECDDLIQSDFSSNSLAVWCTSSLKGGLTMDKVSLRNVSGISALPHAAFFIKAKVNSLTIV
jgi:hypothetical protein